MIPPYFVALASALAAESYDRARRDSDLLDKIMKRQYDAVLLVEDWIAGPPPGGPWAILAGDDGAVYSSLRFLISRPDTLDQAGFGHCGPAAMLSLLFTYFPNTMARFCRDLITTGTGRIGSKVVSATHEMVSVVAEDLRNAAGDNDVPQPLAWLLFAVLEYAMTKDESAVEGLEKAGDADVTAGSNAAMRNAFLQSTGLFKDFVREPASISRFSPTGHVPLTHVELVTKKDKPLREILLGCHGAFLSRADKVRAALHQSHVIWLKTFEPVGSKIRMTYYTWGHDELGEYDSTVVKDHLTQISAFTVVIDAAD